MDPQRIYQGDDNQWYFDVRGNQAKGPYTTFQEANRELSNHISQCRRRLDAPLWPRNWSLFKQSSRATSKAEHS